MYALDYRAGGFGGFGAATVLAPAAARGPIRLSEIAAALKTPAGANPTVKGLLLNAQSSVALMTEAGVATGERLYMEAYALTQVLGQPIALPKDLTVPAATETPATREAAGALTSVLDAITQAFKSSTAPTQPTTVALGPSGPPPATPGVGFVPHALRGAWSVLERPVGPLPAWQWLALGGVGLAVVGIAQRLLKFAAVGGTVAAGAYGLVTYQRWRASQQAQGAVA